MLMRMDALLRWAQDVPRPNGVSIITNCTGVKREGPHRAEEMYLGQQHVRLMAGIERHRNAGRVVRLRVVSAKHGVLDGADVIEPYDVTFHGMCKARFTERVDALGIPAAAEAFLREEAYDLKIVILGLKYLEACRFDFNHIHGTVVFFCSKGHADAMRAAEKERPELLVVPLSDRDARQYHCGAVGLKGELTGHLLDALRDPVAVSWPDAGGRGDIRADL